MNHYTNAAFWKCYDELRPTIQNAAGRKFKLLKSNPQHPSLHFKLVGKYWSVRVNLETRALAIASEADLIWFWIGDHREYEKIIYAQQK